LVTISWPGLKPSLRLKGSGSTGLPAALRGIDSVLKFTRRVVSVVESAVVKWSLGNG
jgi:hypothetical protein